MRGKLPQTPHDPMHGIRFCEGKIERRWTDIKRVWLLDMKVGSKLPFFLKKGIPKCMQNSFSTTSLIIT